MKTYADLNLKKIRDDCGLDFAWHTFNRGQCSCCFGPKDIKKGWAKGKNPQKIVTKQEANGKAAAHTPDQDTDNYTYILFKNADNGSGRIKSLNEPVTDHTYILHRVSSPEQMHKICSMLQEQLGPQYLVKEPEEDLYCICIYYGNIYPVKEVLDMIKESNPRLRKGYWYYFNDVEPKEIVKFDATLRKRMDEEIIHFV